MKTAILVCFLVILFRGNGQELPKDLEPVVVEASTSAKLYSGIQLLNRKEFTLFQPEDLGVLLQRFAGVSMKNYGGLGGLKTFSVRGLGGAHSAILVDGFSVQNTQAGQVDLSTIQTDNVESIALIQGGKSEVLLPVSSYLSGNALLIRTFENQFSPEKVQIRSSLKIGSFGQQDGYASVKWNRKNFFISTFGKTRKAHGRYPFQVENGLHIYEGMRENNALNELYGGISAGLRTSKNSLVKFSYAASSINKGLPGAVIFYNPTANQFLETKAHQANLDFKFAKNGFSSRMYFSGRYDELFYTDSSYLNVAGVLKQAFYQVNAQQGIVLKHTFNADKTSLLYGVEHHVATLKSSNQIASNPTRQHLKTFVSLEHALKKSEFRIQLGAEGLKNTADGSEVYEKAISPSFSWKRSRAHTLFGTPIFWIKRSFRMPNFNEMYFNQVGNIHLKPEIANQANVGSTHLWNLKSLEISTQVNGYVNLVEDKIVAIPTKNVFIWSMQNVGLVRILGVDLQVGSLYKGLKNMQIRANASYSYQKATDQTDRNGFTFGHQIPYIPKYTLQGDVSLVYKKLGVSFSGLYTSARFALNENISTNEIPAFYCLDATVFYRVALKNKQEFTVQTSVKNFTNQAYTFVRYFVMPGRNYLFSINYSFK